MFLVHSCEFLPRSIREKFSFCQVLFFAPVFRVVILMGFGRRFSGEYFYLVTLLWSVLFRYCSAYVFCPFLRLFSRKVSEKNSLFVRSLFWGPLLFSPLFSPFGPARAVGFGGALSSLLLPWTRRTTSPTGVCCAAALDSEFFRPGSVRSLPPLRLRVVSLSLSLSISLSLCFSFLFSLSLALHASCQPFRLVSQEKLRGVVLEVYVLPYAVFCPSF